MEKFFFSMGLGKFYQVIRTYSAGAKCTCRPHLRTYISDTICTEYVHMQGVRTYSAGTICT
jgi:hypothetical protein